MKELVKAFEGHKVRVVLKRGSPWFCLKDICSVLGIINHNDHASKVLDQKGVDTIYSLTNGGNQDLIYINESNLYRTIFKSRKESAIRFQEWVFDDVLPSIRKTGRYEIPATTREKSKQVRNHFTQTLNEHGVASPIQYIKITGTMKKKAGIPGNKPKDQLDRIELMKIEAAEFLASINMLQLDAHGYDECKPICQDAAQAIAISTQIRKEVSA